MTKIINLTQGKTTLVDDTDFDFLNQFKWHVQKSKSRAGYINWYAKKQNISMAEMIIGKIKGLEIDHLDGDGLNNQRKNLRHITHKENCNNRHIRKLSKYNGVYFDFINKKWRCKVKVGDKYINSYCYNTEKEAFSALIKAKLRIRKNPKLNNKIKLFI